MADDLPPEEKVLEVSMPVTDRSFMYKAYLLRDYVVMVDHQATVMLPASAFPGFLVERMGLSADEVTMVMNPDDPSMYRRPVV